MTLSKMFTQSKETRLADILDFLRVQPRAEREKFVEVISAFSKACDLEEDAGLKGSDPLILLQSVNAHFDAQNKAIELDNMKLKRTMG